MEFDELFPDKIDVHVGTAVFKVGTLKIRQIKIVLDAVGKLAEKIRADPTMLENLEDHIVEVVRVGYDQVVAICAAAIDADSDYIENNFDLVGLTRLAKAIVEMNDFDEVIKNCQSVWERLKPTVVTEVPTV